MSQDEPTTNHGHDTSLPSRAVRIAQRQQAAPPKPPVNPRHLAEFTVWPVHVLLSAHHRHHRDGPDPIHPKSLTDFLTDGLRLYKSNLRNPDQIPGTDWFSRLYAMVLFPVLVVSMAIVQDYIDPEGTEEAICQLASRTPHPETRFSYNIANFLLIMCSMAYQRNEKLVAEASKLFFNLTTDRLDRAKQLLLDSEKDIDEKSLNEFGMRFTGINEYLIDVTMQRVDASEYLYGEVHKGFYECLFPDVIPGAPTYDGPYPFKTIMETIFEVAEAAKKRTGKPVNLWVTGHSLGGALAALVMARLQMPLQRGDPLLRGNQVHESRTVLAEMLAQYSGDRELIVLRDCYSVASPKIGDSTFANKFARHQSAFRHASPYKSVYWRVVTNEDIIPHLPPSISVGPCIHCVRTPEEWLVEEQNEDQQQGAHPEHLHSLLDYQHVGQLVTVFNERRVPVVRPSVFEADLSQGVLRTREEVLVFLSNLGNVEPNTPADLDAEATIVLERIRAAQKKTDGVARAQELYNIELSRLRQPGPLQSLILMVPSLLSHAPATYQRDLVRGRLYFKSFPGKTRVLKWLEEATREKEVEELKIWVGDSGHVSGDDDGEVVEGGVATGQ
ncbi:hypothetical protein KI688_002217 [Linnemannia hyalina]|uniref:Fungal lipase-type domain-containing protein n=1 Tax=Linnemannia hyalina TaxID=64524 RepID=A0A9P8BRX0_9FUNG|nr:hypothetical protein KI688_002217 [Linnemannia hyalina]